MSVTQISGQERLRAAMAATAMRRNAPGAAQESPSVVRQPDAVKLSDSARAMAAALKNVADAPDVRTDRVAALKAAIASGTYTVDNRQLASKISTAFTS